MPVAPLKNILFVGLGPHARRIYYPLLEKYAEQYDLRIPLLVDLDDQRDRIEAYLAQRKLQPQEVLYLDTVQRQSHALDPHLLNRLDELVAAHQIDGMILSTEPAAHKPYLLWAVQRIIYNPLVKPENQALAGMDLNWREIGLLLPCNVIVYEDDGRSVVSIADPIAMMHVANNPSLEPVAAEARVRFQRVIAALSR